MLRFVPDDSVDAIVTDSPYSSGGLMRSDRNQPTGAKYERCDVARPRASFSGDNRDGRAWAYWSTLWMSECFRALREGGVEGFVQAYDFSTVPPAWRDTVETVVRQRLSLHEHPAAVADAMEVVSRSRPFEGFAELAAHRD